MKNKQERKLEWRRLDNSAKIFPISTGKKYSTVFRLSCILKERVNPILLQKALKETLEKYRSFRVRMKAGFFWYYLEDNPKEPFVTEEKEYPCQYIDPKTNGNYLLKVTYFERKINIDIFHALTDGGSATVFFRELIYSYLELVHPEALREEKRIPRKIEDVVEDGYLKNFDRRVKGRDASGKAYQLKGSKIGLGGVAITHEIINFSQLREASKKEGCTVTQYLTAVLLYAIYQGNYKHKKGKKPIKICIPVNLKKYFPSKTMSNFFSYLTVIAPIQKKQLDTFEKILPFVKREFEEKLTEEEIIKTMSANVRLGNHPLIRAIPLVLKKPMVRLAYTQIRKYTTITLSNIGRIGVMGKYQNYIENFFLLIAPEPVEKIKCSACSFGDEMVFTFTSILKDTKIEKEFYDFLTKQGIQVEIESNGVLDVISKEN